MHVTLCYPQSYIYLVHLKECVNLEVDNCINVWQIMHSNTQKSYCLCYCIIFLSPFPEKCQELNKNYVLCCGENITFFFEDSSIPPGCHKEETTGV